MISSSIAVYMRVVCVLCFVFPSRRVPRKKRRSLLFRRAKNFKKTRSPPRGYDNKRTLRYCRKASETTRVRRVENGAPPTKGGWFAHHIGTSASCFCIQQKKKKVQSISAVASPLTSELASPQLPAILLVYCARHRTLPKEKGSTCSSPHSLVYYYFKY